MNCLPPEIEQHLKIRPEESQSTSENSMSMKTPPASPSEAMAGSGNNEMTGNTLDQIFI